MASLDHAGMQNPEIIDILLPTYHMKPQEDEKFYSSEARAAAEIILREELAGRNLKFSEANSKEWAIKIADRIKKSIRALRVPRYKVVVQVTIGEMKDQGVRVASRCLWDTSTDNYASVSYNKVGEAI